MSVIHQITLGHVVLDDVTHADGTTEQTVLGGAGTYAALAQALVAAAGEVGVVSGVGEDLDAGPRAELERSGLDTAGLVALDARTPRTRIVYAADGEREETPAYGLDHFAALDPTAELVPATYRRARGIYLFDAINAPLVDALGSLRDAHGATVLWEVRADVCTPEHRAAVLDQASRVDVVSLNRTEVTTLCETEDVVAAAHLLHAVCPVVVLRLGPEGALVLTSDGLVRATPPPGPVVDPTGAGNAFSGAFVAALTEQPDPAHALAVAMAAAALTIRQPGPPLVTDALRAELRQTAAAVPLRPAPPRPRPRTDLHP